MAGRGRRIGIAALSLLLGRAAPRRALPLVAEVLKLPGNRVLALMQQGPAPSDKELELCIATRQKSLACMMVMRCRSY